MACGCSTSGLWTLSLGSGFRVQASGTGLRAVRGWGLKKDLCAGL